MANVYLEPFDIAKVPIIASISGHIAEINLEYVDSIYKDRGNSKNKDGYWVKFLEPCSYTGKVETIKLYFSGLTTEQRSVIMYAARFNQLMRTINNKGNNNG